VFLLFDLNKEETICSNVMVGLVLSPVTFHHSSFNNQTIEKTLTGDKQ